MDGGNKKDLGIRRRESESESHSVMSSSLRPHGLYSPWNSPGQNTGVDSLSLLQEIFPAQELNPGLPHCRQSLYQLSDQGSPRILEWVRKSIKPHIFNNSVMPNSRELLKRNLCLYDRIFMWLSLMPCPFPGNPKLGIRLHTSLIMLTC